MKALEAIETLRTLSSDDGGQVALHVIEVFKASEPVRSVKGKERETASPALGPVLVLEEAISVVLRWLEEGASLLIFRVSRSCS